MKLAVKALVVLLAVALSGAAHGKAAKKPAAKPDLGTVVKVDDAATPKTLTYKTATGGDANPITVSVPDTTIILIDGVAGALKDIKVDAKVAVTAENGAAKQIETPPPPPDKPKKGAKAAKNAGN